MSTKDNSGPAFPMQDQQAIHAYAQARVELAMAKKQNPMDVAERDAEYIQARAEAIGGMTLRQYAAIKLKVPDSSLDWLDEMINKSRRADFAANALTGLFANGRLKESANNAAVAVVAHGLADAMLEASKS